MSEDPSRRRTTCNRDCPDACGIVATVEDGRVTRLAGDPDHPVTRGYLCYRTGHFLARQYGPDRLTTPLVRAAPGAPLEPASWDEALDRVAERLLAIRRESGPAAILHYRSGGTLGALAAVTELLFERFGPVTVKRGDVCSGAGEAAQVADFGDCDSSAREDLLHARSLLLWGKNPVVSSPHTVPLLRRARARGARLALVDPVHGRSAALAEVHIQPRPGGDFALAMAVARLLFDRGWVDPDAGAWCEGLPAFRALVEGRSLAAWCAEADVPPTDALELARRLGPGGRPATILVGWGLQRQPTGGAAVRALDALAAITGNVGVPGGGVSFYFKRRAAFDLSFVRGEAAAPRTLLEPLLGREIRAAADPPIRAVWVTAGNPVAMLPESEVTREALRTRELVVVADAFLTDTADAAHVVLPTTTLLEADDLLGAFGHHYLGVARPVVPPPPGVKSDLEIAQALAARLGLADVVAGTARDWQRRIAGPCLAAHGLSLEALEEGARPSPVAPGVLFAGRRFPTPSGRVRLIGAAPPPEPAPPPGYPLRLLALSHARSQCSQWAVPADGPLEATVHPDAARAAGLPGGGPARLESPHGGLDVLLVLDARQRRDVVVVPKGGQLRDGRCANALLGGLVTDLGEGASLYHQAVALRAPEPSDRAIVPR